MLKRISVIIAIAFGFSFIAGAKVVERPDSAHQRPVVDLAGVLRDSAAVSRVNAQLDSLYKHTKCPVQIVTVPTTDDREAIDYAHELFDNWGIGDKKLNNGLLLLIKPKSGEEKGGLAIATGYALEGVFSDALCRRIEENKMVPYLKNDDYMSAVSNAVDTIASIITTEFSPERAAKPKKSGGGIGWLGGLLCLGGAGAVVWLIFFRKPKPGTVLVQPQAQPDGLKGNAAPEEEEESPEERERERQRREREREESEREEREREARQRKLEEAKRREENRFKLGGGKTGGGGAQTSW